MHQSVATKDLCQISSRSVTPDAPYVSLLVTFNDYNRQKIKSLQRCVRSTVHYHTNKSAKIKGDITLQHIARISM